MDRVHDIYEGVAEYVIKHDYKHKHIKLTPENIRKYREGIVRGVTHKEKDAKGNEIQVENIGVLQVMTDEQMAKMEGEFVEKSGYKFIADAYNNCDIWGLKPDGTDVLLAKVRRGVLSQSQCEAAFKALEPFAKKTWNTNRGAAAGKVSLRRLPKYVGEVEQQGAFRIYYRDRDGKLRKDNISNRVRSNIIGYFDQPDRNKLAGGQKAPKIPCRMTAWTRDHPKEWEESIVPFVKDIDRQFKYLLPERHQVQQRRAAKTPDFQIGKTAFSTVTVNYNYQSATHKDAGDLEEGFGNLIVLERSKCNVPGATEYEGGYLVFPQYAVAIDVRQGDFCAVNVHEWHCNTPIIGKLNTGELAKSGKPASTKKTLKNSRNSKSRDQTKEKSKLETWGRMTLVCYLRRDMYSKCGYPNPPSGRIKLEEYPAAQI